MASFHELHRLLMPLAAESGDQRRLAFPQGHRGFGSETPALQYKREAASHGEQPPCKKPVALTWFLDSRNHVFLWNSGSALSR